MTTWTEISTIDIPGIGPMRETVEYTGPMDKPEPIHGTVTREMEFWTDHGIPDVVVVNGVRFLPDRG